MDKEMQELVDTLGAAVVPITRRRPRYHTSWHTPYYRDTRYRRV